MRREVARIINFDLSLVSNRAFVATKEGHAATVALTSLVGTFAGTNIYKIRIDPGAGMPSFDFPGGAKTIAGPGGGVQLSAADMEGVSSIVIEQSGTASTAPAVGEIVVTQDIEKYGR